MMFDLPLMKLELKRDEGERLMPYKDTVGKTTIGVGRNLDDVGISEAEKEFMLLNDITRTQQYLDMALPWWTSLSDVRQRALLNMTFDLDHKIMEFTDMLKALKAGDWQIASQEALNSTWAKETGSRAQRIAVQFVTG